MIETGVMSLWRMKEGHQDELMWMLSVLVNHQKFKHFELYSDVAGAKFLVDDLKLPFDRVNTSLEGFEQSFWAAGKMRTYQLMDKPFVHMDHDVFLFKSLPERLLAANALAQHIEILDERGRWDKSAVTSNIIYPFDLLATRYKLPTNWLIALLTPGSRLAYNAGILGGNDLESIRRYVHNSFKILNDNRSALQDGLTSTYVSVLFEQFAFGVELDHQIETLFSGSITDEAAQNAGYTHFCANSKYQKIYRTKALARLKKDFPVECDKMLHYVANKYQQKRPEEYIVSKFLL